MLHLGSPVTSPCPHQKAREQPSARHFLYLVADCELTCDSPNLFGTASILHHLAEAGNVVDSYTDLMQPPCRVNFGRF